MRKYIGKYRVLAERDDFGEITDGEFTYLIGTGNYSDCKIYRHSDNVLKLLVIGQTSAIVSNMLKKFKESKIEVVGLVDCKYEGFIMFNEKDLAKVAGIINARTSGASTKPESLRNHPNYKEIKQEKYNSLSEEQKEKLRLRGEALRDRLNNKD